MLLSARQTQAAASVDTNASMPAAKMSANSVCFMVTSNIDFARDVALGRAAK
jgi:hypothetical protein